ncbi:MAG: hypothetical protein QOF06_141 [Solirubrobacterales bacterium]|nr:hypothetical protein [Solirubrobacterales bacterium]
MAEGSVGEAQDKAQEVAGEAQEKARAAAAQAQEGVRTRIDDRSTQVGERVTSTAGDLRSVGEELRKQGKETPAKLADRAAEETEKVGSYLKENGPDKMLEDVEDFGRQRPWAVLAGGVAVGVLAARFLKASSRSRYQQRNGAGAPTQTLGTSPLPPHRSPVEPVVTPPSPAPAPHVAPPAPSAAP